MRTSAIVYAEELPGRKTTTIKRKFIESIFVNNSNKALDTEEIANAIEDVLKISLTEAEIRDIVSNSEYFNEIGKEQNTDNKYNLTDKRYITLSEKTSNGIEEIVDLYLKSSNISLSKEVFSSLIKKYLYSLMNSNIAAYEQVINPKHNKGKITIDSTQFSSSEIKEINSFLFWDNDEKDKTLFKLVCYCLEYAIVVNNSSENALIKSLRNKTFYLDNAFIYRAIGINGKTRKARALAFLNKCKESGQNLVISKYTKVEFTNSIDYHLKQLERSTPYGKINPYLFQEYANGGDFYEFYHEWRSDNNRITYGFQIFRDYLNNLYHSFLERYKIIEDLNAPFDENESASIIEKYQKEISIFKVYSSYVSCLSDASNMYWMEMIRGKNNSTVGDTKYYFITSDQKLHVWDFSHSPNQPITLLPSQWMGILLKFVSRTTDDYKSFVSFLNIPQNDALSTPDELQKIMAGISEITEDFSKQGSIISSMVEADFDNIVKKGDIQSNAKAFAKDKLEEDYNAQLATKDKEYISNTEKQKKENENFFRAYDTLNKKNKIEEINKTINRLMSLKNNAEKRANKRIALLKTITCCIYAAVIIVIFKLIKTHGWNFVSMCLALSVPISGILGYMYLCIYNKSCKMDVIWKEISNRYKQKFYTEYTYNDDDLQELESMKKKLSQEIESLNKQI